MRRLGISIYPEHASLEENRKYIEMAAKYGYKRIFTCLLSVEGNKETVVSEFKDLIALANSFGMEVILDVSPSVFTDLGISYDDLSFFHEIGATGIRLDMGFTGMEESFMTFNPYDLKIEINISMGTRYIENIIAYDPKRSNLIGCHNFYPHRYTGLSLEHFERTSRQYRENGIRTAAFINSPSATFGPWPVSEGLCTLEMHRDMDMVAQAKHLFATGLVDDVIIANAFATEEELKAISMIDKDMLTFEVELLDTSSETERKIVLEESHFNRGDVSDYVIRSTMSRIKFAGQPFPPHDTDEIRKGDILIDSDLYSRYAGELMVARLPMENAGKTSIVGRISEQEVFLLDLVQPWQKFRFVEKKKP